MADDPYTVLGVARDATDKQIRSAFLKLAKTSHRDLHPGDAKAEEKFKAASAANDLLSDPERRARFDRGEIDPSTRFPWFPLPQVLQLTSLASDPVAGNG